MNPTATTQVNPAFATVGGKATNPVKRILSLDVVRGITIAFMIMVNNNGGEQALWAFKHADWNGFTPTDLVFPTFLFLVGVAIAYSTAARLAKGATAAEIFAHALRRSVILFLLGLVVNSFPYFDFATMRYYGVLPRIAICNLVVTALYLISPAWRNKLVLAIAALLGYWALMRFVPVPGYGVPARDIGLLDPDANLAAWLDRQIFSAAHLYEHTRDPEGLLSTLPALATTLMGLLAGCWLRSDKTLEKKVQGLVLAGIACVFLGAAWNFEFPINKKLWTSSFVLFAGGWSLLLLAAFLYIADLRRAGESHTNAPGWYTPLLVLGTNSIAAYVFSELLATPFWMIKINDNLSLQQWLSASLQHVIPNGALAALTYSLLYLAVCWLPMYWLYRHKIFIKI